MINTTGLVLHKNGGFELFTGTQGTIVINIRTLLIKAGAAVSSYPINLSTCSQAGSFSASVTIVRGTGLYKGIHGTVSLKNNYALV